MLEIRTIEKSDWNVILTLSVSQQQRGYIESSEKCICDAMTSAYDMEWNFYGIYLGETLIGFAMHGLGDAGYINRTKLWLDRFMVDEKYQGSGNGKKSMLLIVEKLYKDYNKNEIYLSVHDDNLPAIKLYKELGFTFTGEIDPMGELVMCRVKIVN